MKPKLQVVNWISGTGKRSKAFDFPLRYALQSATSNNNYGQFSQVPGVIGRMANSAVTFVENHDTGHTSPFGSSDNVAMAYAYIMTHPGTPMAFWPHWVSDVGYWHTPNLCINSVAQTGAPSVVIGLTPSSPLFWQHTTLIGQLIGIRKSAGVTSTSSVSIDKAQNGLYAAYVGRLAMKLGTDSWSPPDSKYKVRATAPLRTGPSCCTKPPTIKVLDIFFTKLLLKFFSQPLLICAAPSLSFPKACHKWE